MSSLPSLLRILMLGLLMAGVMMKPVLAIACEIHDMQKIVAAEPAAAAEAPGPGSGESCCSLPDCNDCCAHTTALLPILNLAPAAPMAASSLPSLSVEFEPTAFPVAFRPPIPA